MRPDEGPSYPPLPADAGPDETRLYEIYDFQSGIVSYTAGEWRTTAEELSDLAVSVRGVVSQLKRAPDSGEGWSGSAAEAAYDSLGKLAANLDRHAEDITRIESGLTAAYDAIGEARTQYVTKVRTVDTSIDPAGYMKENPGPPGGATLEPTLDSAAYDAAVADARAAREREARTVMASYEVDMEAAAKKLPVEPADSPVSDGRYPSGPTGGNGPYGGGSGPSGGSYVPPGGGGGWVVGTGGPDGPGGDGPRDDGPDWPPQQPPDDDDDICSGYPVLDGDEDGGLLPQTGNPGPTGGATVPGGTGGSSGLGGGSALGLGGMAVGGGAAALMGRGGAGGAGLFGRGGVVGVGNTGSAAGRGTGATGTAGRSSVVGGASQGANARGTTGRGAAGGRGATGRYGVPQLGEKGGRGSGAAAAGSAGSRGKGERKDGQDVDHLTTEDEETWFEGADDASPPVWE